MRRLKKKIFLGLFGGTVAVLGLVRLQHPELTGGAGGEESPPAEGSVLPRENSCIPTGKLQYSFGSTGDEALRDKFPALSADSAGRVRWHPVRSVPSYAKCFPDVQDVQIVAARQWGIRPVESRDEMECRRKELVYIGASPFYQLDKRMTHSVPYLVPRAADLLQTIARNYLDSLYVKGIPLHRCVVTSILRTEDDVARLQRSNKNATDQSCHLFGTTFDISYINFSTVSPPGGPARRAVRDDTLKWVLSEVLRDLREQGRCYVKYEVRQSCFHITVR